MCTFPVEESFTSQVAMTILYLDIVLWEFILVSIFDPIMPISMKITLCQKLLKISFIVIIIFIYLILDLFLSWFIIT